MKTSKTSKTSPTLEDFLKTPNETELDKVVTDVINHNKFDLSEPVLFVSKQDKFFDSIMQNLEESEKSTELKISVKPLFNDDFDVDGVYVSFSKKF